LSNAEKDFVHNELARRKVIAVFPPLQGGDQLAYTAGSIHGTPPASKGVDLGYDRWREAVAIFRARPPVGLVLTRTACESSSITRHGTGQRDNFRN